MNLGGTQALGRNTMMSHDWLCGPDTSWVAGCKLMQILGLRKECKLVWTMPEWTYPGVPLYMSVPATAYDGHGNFKKS